jgi:hypothetical protein
MYAYREYITAGGLINGEKPADLPVQQVTKVELIVNLKTAKAHSRSRYSTARTR